MAAPASRSEKTTQPAARPQSDPAMQDIELLVQALALLSLVLWLTPRAFPLGTKTDRRILVGGYVALAAAFSIAIAATIAHFWRS